jgi:4-amino-4-deoxy-L-arabinose transferase-like glycosyltransferase
MEHRGYGLVANDGWFGPLVTYMPAFPAMLAIAGSFGVDLPTAARWITIGLFAVNIALVAMLIWFNSDRATFAAWIGAALFALSPTALRVHTSALSEPLFIASLLGSVAMLSLLVKSSAPPWTFAACGVTLGLAYLTRYAALPFIGALLLTTLCAVRGSWRRRITCAAIIAATCALAIVPWMIRNHRLGISSMGRTAGWHPVKLANLQLGLQTIGEWFVPVSLPRTVVAYAVYGLAIALAAVIYIQFRKTRHIAESFRPSFPLTLVVAVLALIYGVFLISSITFFDAAIPLDWRLLTPLFVLLIVSVCTWIGTTPNQSLRRAAAPLVLTIVFISAWAAVVEANSMRREGIGYTADMWRDSPTIAALKQFPPDVQVYSNGWDVIYFYTGRHTQLLPNKPEEADAASGDTFNARMQQLEDELKARHAVIAYLHHGRRGPLFLNEAELMQQLSIRRLGRYDDGAIYVWQRRSQTGK